MTKKNKKKKLQILEKIHGIELLVIAIANRYFSNIVLNFQIFNFNMKIVCDSQKNVYSINVKSVNV